MKKFLVVYVSRTGKTKQMAEWIAEGLRFAGHEAVLRTLPQVKQVEDIAGYDGYVLGSPTYHKAMIEGFNSWLFKAQRAGVQGKIGGAFGSHTHSGEAPQLLADTMEHVFKMKPVSLGTINLLEAVVDTDEGRKIGHDYAKTFAQEL